MYFLVYGALAALVTLVLTSISTQSSFGRRIGVSALAFMIFGVMGWLIMPTYNLNFIGNWLMLCFFGAFVIGACFWVSSGEGKIHEDFRGPFMVVPVTVGIVAVLFVAPVRTWSLLHHEEYQKLLGEVSVSTFAEDVSPVNVNQVRRVDQTLAYLLGSKRVEELPGLGSRVDLDTMNVQLINGCFDTLDGNNEPERLCFENELVWAGPLVHGGLFKWFTNDTTPGYVLVSASNQSEVHLVTALGVPAESVTTNAEATTRMGTAEVATEAMTPLALRYLRSGAYFGDWLNRHVREAGFISEGLGYTAFEIDDTGRPYFVVTTFDNTVGFSGADTSGVLVVDAQTGDVNQYAAADAPAWVDRIQPEEMVVSQLKSWGLYAKGYWNTWFGRQDIVTTTGDDMSLVYGADGHSYWYIGLQSAGSDMGTNSFVLVDTRSKEVRRYMIAGANEAAARASAENAPGVREAGYAGTYPILYNVSGVPTYFLTLKGGDGLIKMYAFVSVENYESVGVGESVQAALRDYQNTLIRQGQQTSFNDLVQMERVKAIVNQVVQIDDTFYLLVEHPASVEFYGTTDVSPELKWAKQGDWVVILFNRGEDQRSVQIGAFDVLRLDISKLPE